MFDAKEYLGKDEGFKIGYIIFVGERKKSDWLHVNVSGTLCRIHFIALAV